MKSVIVYALTIFITLCDSARILVIIPTPSLSHQLVYRPLWRELSLRGHQITLLTTDPVNDPTLTNLTEIDLHSSYDVWNKHFDNLFDGFTNILKMLTIVEEFIRDFTDVLMKHSFVQKILNDSTIKFDLVMTEALITPASAFSKKFNCPLIGIWSVAANEIFYNYFGLPIHPILYPDPMLKFDQPDTFLERVMSTINNVIAELFVKIYLDYMINPLIDEYFGKGYTTINEILSQASMLFVNENPSVDNPRPVVPAVLYLKGIHQQPTNPLPKELKTALDSASEGFIYFSLGTNVKSKNLQLKTIQTIQNTFSKLPYKVFWKLELDKLVDKPDNVIISKWFPQFDMLKHPNIKLFITHGGIASLEESISARVPMVAMPFFGDQFRNVRRIVRQNIGLSLDFATLEEEMFKNTILEVIKNPRYRKNIEEIADLMQDQPMTSLEQAIWWTEYVIRHKGATHLKGPLADISWSQYLFLDVFAFLFVVLILVTLFIYLLIHIIIKFFKKVFIVKPKRKQL